MAYHLPLKVIQVRRRQRKGFEAKVPSQGVSQLGMGLEKIISGNEESDDEEEVAPPLIQSWCSRGRAVSVGIEVMEKPQLKVASASSMTSEGAEMRSGSPSVIMSALKIGECNPTTGPIGGKVPITEAPSVQVLSSSFEGDDYDIGYELAPHDAWKFSHMIEEEMQVAAPEMELSSRETATTEGILSFQFMTFLAAYIDVI